MQYGGVLGRSFYLFFKLILDQNSSKIVVLYFMLEVVHIRWDSWRNFNNINGWSDDNNVDSSVFRFHQERYSLKDTCYCVFPGEKPGFDSIISNIHYTETKHFKISTLVFSKKSWSFLNRNLNFLLLFSNCYCTVIYWNYKTETGFTPEETPYTYWNTAGFYGALIYKLRKNRGHIHFQELFIKRIKTLRKKGNDHIILQRTAYLVTDPFAVGNFACTMTERMMILNYKWLL